MLLADFSTMAAAGEAVCSITAAGLLPAGMETDNVTINAVDDFFEDSIQDAAAAF